MIPSKSQQLSREAFLNHKKIGKRINTKSIAEDIQTNLKYFEILIQCSRIFKSFIKARINIKNMKRFSKSQEKNRAESVKANKTNNIQGILKKPNKHKLKRQRSVRFEEPEASQHYTESNLDFYLTENSQASTLNTVPSKSQFSSTSPARSSGYQNKAVNENLSKTPLKTIQFEKQEIRLNLKRSPKNSKNVLKFDCRDERFYTKLNFFLTVKESLSPVFGSSLKNEKDRQKALKKTSVLKSRFTEDPQKNTKINASKKGKSGNGCLLINNV